MSCCSWMVRLSRLPAPFFEGFPRIAGLAMIGGLAVPGPVAELLRAVPVISVGWEGARRHRSSGLGCFLWSFSLVSFESLLRSFETSPLRETQASSGRKGRWLPIASFWTDFWTGWAGANCLLVSFESYLWDRTAAYSDRKERWL